MTNKSPIKYILNYLITIMTRTLKNTSHKNDHLIVLRTTMLFVYTTSVGDISFSFDDVRDI